MVAPILVRSVACRSGCPTGGSSQTATRADLGLVKLVKMTGQTFRSNWSSRQVKLVKLPNRQEKRRAPYDGLSKPPCTKQLLLQQCSNSIQQQHTVTRQCSQCSQCSQASSEFILIIMRNRLQICSPRYGQDKRAFVGHCVAISSAEAYRVAKCSQHSEPKQSDPSELA
jgi:hypothetical protein